MRRLPTVTAAASLAVIGFAYAATAAEAQTEEAPFGLTWGLVDKVPRPLKVDREVNLTALYYPQGWPPALGVGTAEVILVVCRDEGLQQVVWVGLPMSGEALAKTQRAIHDEGVRRYGEPGPGPVVDSELWPGGRALLASRSAPDGQKELVMTVFGPSYAACSKTHRSEAGHSAGSHVADLIGGSSP